LLVAIVEVVWENDFAKCKPPLLIHNENGRVKTLKHFNSHLKIDIYLPKDRPF
jgi:hypothetical protein